MSENMVRTQVYLPRAVRDQLQKRAKRHQLTLAVQIREALESYLLENAAQTDDGILHADDPIFQMIGAASSKEGDLSVNHDYYLYGMPKREPDAGKGAAHIKEKRAAYKVKRKSSTKAQGRK